MTEDRAKRFDEHLKRELGKIIFDLLETEPGVLITITRVMTNPNLFSSDIYVSVYPSNFAEETLEKLNKSIWEIQQELNKKLKVRPVPKIIFKFDKNPEEAADVERLIEEIKEK